MNDNAGIQSNIGERRLAMLSLRVLVTAQPFGFGPAAALAQIFDYLRPRVRFFWPSSAPGIHATST